MRLRAALVPALLALAGCGSMPPQQAAADLVIANGRVYSGADEPARNADVVVRGERIVEVAPGAAARHPGARVIDATGLVVAPGFIDPHTHPDTYIRSADPGERRNAPWLFQGVTTIAIGNDGYGSFDIAGEQAWFARHGVGTNLVPYVGFGPVRRQVIGSDDRAPTAEELQRMRALVARGMCEGGFGLSTGLFYVPQRYARTGEVAALAREAALRGGRYDSHLRDEGSYSIGVLAAVDEAIAIGRQAGLPVHIAHLKALGAQVHGQGPAIVARIQAARAAGQQVSADQYPWLASGTNLGAALLPPWSVDGGRARLAERLADPATAARIREEMARNLELRGGPSKLLLTGLGWEWTGKTLEQMAAAWKVPPIDAALRVIATPRAQDAAPARAPERITSFNMDAGDLAHIMRQPWVATSSDGSDGHPRQFGSFPEKYRRYVVEQGVIDEAAFIRRSTGLTADLLGLRDRGYLRAGAFADVVVFDPARLQAKATYLEPRQLSEGVVMVLVNGTPAIEAGQLTDARAGRVLRHVPPAGSCEALP